MAFLLKNIIGLLTAIKQLECLPEEMRKKVDEILDRFPGDIFLSEERLEKFKKVLKNAGAPIAVILTHLDPDSIACARIFIKICEEYDVQARIFYCGVLDDPQNKFIWNKFKLMDDFKPIENLATLKDAEKYRTVLLDSSSLADQRLGQFKINPMIIIDHHPSKTQQLEETEDTWFYIHTCGAAVSLMVQLFLSLELRFAQGDDLATLAIIGIKTDTKILDSTDLDIGVLAYLLIGKYADTKRAKETEDAMKDLEYLRLFHQAYANMQQEGNISVTCLSFMQREKIGLIARLADELCGYKGIDTVVMWAIADDNCVYVKVRSVDNKLDLDDFIKKNFGMTRGGAREGGKGAAMIPLDFFSPTTDSREDLLGFLKKHITSKVLKLSAR